MSLTWELGLLLFHAACNRVVNSRDLRLNGILLPHTGVLLLFNLLCLLVAPLSRAASGPVFSQPNYLGRCCASNAQIFVTYGNSPLVPATATFTGRPRYGPNLSWDEPSGATPFHGKVPCSRELMELLTTVRFKYDPFGRRIYKSSNSGTSIFAYDGDNLIEETNGSGAVVVSYSHGLNLDEPLAMVRINRHRRSNSFCESVSWSGDKYASTRRWPIHQGLGVIN